MLRDTERELSNVMSGERKRTLRLFCPSLSKVVPFVARDEQRLDLGSIARAFGLEPATLKLNGHFIGRGVDFVASSVTWRSLLSFFSSRGLATGATDADALIVDGTFAKAGAKRVQGQLGSETGTCYVHSSSANIVPQHEDMDMVSSKKLRESSTRYIDRSDKVSPCDGFSLKRKHLLEDLNPLKRFRMKGADLGSQAQDVILSNKIRNNIPQCSFIGDCSKRIREDEMVMTAPCKRARS